MEIIRQYRPVADLFIITDVDEYLLTFEHHKDTELEMEMETLPLKLYSGINSDITTANTVNTANTANTAKPKPIKPIVNRPIINKHSIWRHLKLFYYSNYSALKMLPSYNSIVTDKTNNIQHITYFETNYYKPTHCKVIYKAKDVVKIDHGNHYAHIRKKNHSISTYNIGFLHYHNRNPLNTIQRAIINAIGLKQLPINTTIDTLHRHTEYLTQISRYNKTIQGYKKLMELLLYIEYGLDGFVTHIDTEVEKGVDKKVVFDRGVEEESEIDSSNGSSSNDNNSSSSSASSTSSSNIIQLPTLHEIIKQLHTYR